MRRLALESFAVLGCRDVSRVDFRTDRHGRPFVIELNPLPGMTPKFSDLVMIAEAAGIDYRGLIGRVLEGAIRRRRLGLV
jgi:D-alanine-D-alanine ligase